MHNWIIKSLKESGSKITAPRQAVATYLVKHDLCTFKPADIIAALPTLDRVSIYRTIELFSSVDVIHPTVVLDGNQYYEMHQHSKHHHHSFCNGCGSSSCVTCPVSKDQTSHHTLFYTEKVCAKCS